MMIARTDPDPLTRLRDQVDRFRSDVDRARLRLETVTGETRHTRSAVDNLDRAEAGLRNAERLLREHESLPDRRDDRPP